MMTELVPFSEYVDFINGDRGKNYPKENDYVDKGIPFISARDLEIDLDDSSSFNNYISKESYEKLRSGKVENGDILFCLRGSVGKHSFVNSLDMAAIASSLVIIRAKQDIEKRFIHYLLNDSSVKRLIQSYENGSVQGNLSVKDLSGVLVPYIDSNIQRDISKFLELFDRKIELNKNLNTVLEQITSKLFKSWFIDFDPVRAKAEGRPTGLSKEISNLFPDSFEDSELGEIPKGWEVKKVGECMEFNYGKALTAKNRVYGNIPVYGSNGIVGYHDTKNSNGPGIIVGRAGNPGTVHWSQKDYYVIDSAFSVNIFNNVSAEYFFYALKNLRLQRLNTGSAIPGLNRNHAYSENIVVPKLKLLEWFNQFSQNIFADQDCRLAENKNLSEIRDTLLPKLILGKIKVPDLDESLEKDR